MLRISATGILDERGRIALSASIRILVEETNENIA
jgi:hypothetical protein